MSEDTITIYKKVLRTYALDLFFQLPIQIIWQYQKSLRRQLEPIGQRCRRPGTKDQSLQEPVSANNVWAPGHHHCSMSATCLGLHQMQSKSFDRSVFKIRS